jgi:hypothetical protein
MKNIVFITELTNQVQKNIRLLETNTFSKIDIDICLESIRKLYLAISELESKETPTINSKQIESINEETILIHKEESEEPIDFTEEIINEDHSPIEIEAQEEEKTKEKEESKLNQEPEKPKEIDKEPHTFNSTKPSQTDLFGSVPNNSNNTEPKKTLGEQLGANKRSINEAFAQTKHSNDIASKIQQKPVTDIKAAIGIGDRFLFIKELFNGDNEKFNQTITLLNGMEKYEMALQYLTETFNWDTEETTVHQFLNIVSRKYQ